MIEDLKTALSERILVLDGAMGTQIQRYWLKEEDYRGGVFADHPQKLEGVQRRVVPHASRRHS